MMWTSGPPWCPGKTFLSIAAANSCLERMRPARGPRSVLWVVLVTICAYGTGDGCTPPATRPANGAAFIGDGAHTRKVECPRIGAAATNNDLGLFAKSGLFELVVVDGLGILA